MRERKTGTIVNISSSTAVDPVPALGIYAATKFAMEGMVLSALFFRRYRMSSFLYTTMRYILSSRLPDKTILTLSISALRLYRDAAGGNRRLRHPGPPRRARLNCHGIRFRCRLWRQSAAERALHARRYLQAGLGFPLL